MKRVTFGLSLLIGCLVANASAAEPMAAQPMAGHSMGGKAEATCGQMISSMAPIPAKLSEGATSVADMLDAHAAFMGKDKDSVAEAKGLRALAKTHMRVAAELKKTSDEMKKAASWPAAPHDMAKMNADPKLAAATQKMIDTHKEIIAMFQKMVADMEAQAREAHGKMSK
jgi:hypothetical protein